MRIFDFLFSIVFGPGLSAAVFGCGIALTLSLELWKRPGKLIAALRPEKGGGMSSARAMCVALAGTLGVGNIAGVASAIAIGGDGAVFWMIVSSFFAMAIKYAETVLALGHRRKLFGTFHGGAFFVFEDLGTGFSRFSAYLFAVLCVLSSFMIGSSVQSDAAAACLEMTFGVDPRISGAVLGILAFLVVSGGLSRISDVTSAAVPVASIGIVVISFYIIIANLGLIPSVISSIISDALGAGAFSGGIFGFLTSRTLSIGVARGVVSNEAGCGTAPIAHSSSDVKIPAVQGVWGMLEVAIDTPVLCTLTALVVLIARERGVVLTADGMETALMAYGEFIPFSGIFLSAAVTIFAFAAMICWFYYGSESLRFISGVRRGKALTRVYSVFYSFAVFFGAFVPGGILWSLSDISISAMTILNLFCVMRCLPAIKRETDAYFGGSWNSVGN